MGRSSMTADAVVSATRHRRRQGQYYSAAAGVAVGLNNIVAKSISERIGRSTRFGARETDPFRNMALDIAKHRCLSLDLGCQTIQS